MALILAKEVLQFHKSVNEMYASMAQIDSVMMNMDHQLGRSCDGHVSCGLCVMLHVMRDSSPRSVVLLLVTSICLICQ